MIQKKKPSVQKMKGLFWKTTELVNVDINLVVSFSSYELNRL